MIALGYEEVALDDFWQTFLQELDALPTMEMGQLEVRQAGSQSVSHPHHSRGTFCSILVLRFLVVLGLGLTTT